MQQLSVTVSPHNDPYYRSITLDNKRQCIWYTKYIIQTYKRSGFIHGKKHVIMHAKFGYVGADDRLEGYDLQDAGLINDEDLNVLLNDSIFEQEDMTVTSFTEQQLRDDLPFELEPHRPLNISSNMLNGSFAENKTTTQAERYALLNPSYGYLNQNAEYKSFDLSDAALYTDSDMKRLDLNEDQFIKQPFTERQIEQFHIPIALKTIKEPEVYSTPAFDINSLGDGLDDLDREQDQTQNQ